MIHYHTEKWEWKSVERSLTTFLLTPSMQAPNKTNKCKAKGIKMGFVLGVLSCDTWQTAKSLLFRTTKMIWHTDLIWCNNDICISNACSVDQIKHSVLTGGGSSCSSREDRWNFFSLPILIQTPELKALCQYWVVLLYISLCATHWNHVNLRPGIDVVLTLDSVA